MKFGSTPDPALIDFSLPKDHTDTAKVLRQFNDTDPFEVYVGCAKWNRQDLKGFYPRGTKDELTYYSRQFNAIELNATFYKSPGKAQVIKWAEKTPGGFKFFPKIPNTISHLKRLDNVKPAVEEFCDAVIGFEKKLGMVFLQMHENFHPKFMDRVGEFVGDFPKEVPLAIEVRHEDWFGDQSSFDRYHALLLEQNVTNIIVDAAGRRDLLHMRLSGDTAFIRYVGANHPSDYTRLDDWIEKIKAWRSLGLRKLYFFVHQNLEKESPKLSAYFIDKLNRTFDLSLKVPAFL